MPPILTSQRMLLLGVILTVVGLLSRLFLLAALTAIWGNGALNNTALAWIHTLLSLAAFQLGLALVVFSFVARAIEMRSSRLDGIDTAQLTDDAPDRAAHSATSAAKRIFWLGIALSLLGLILQRWMDAWAYDLSGGAGVGAGLARDILLLVGPALEALAFPLGILLVAASFVVRLVEREPAKTPPVLR